MKLALEVTGGFTGPAGTQRVEVELDDLPAAQARPLRDALEQIPESAWGGTFTLPHPKPWDFRHVLKTGSGGDERVVTFHRGAGPPALTRLAESLLER